MQIMADPALGLRGPFKTLVIYILLDYVAILFLY